MPFMVVQVLAKDIEVRCCFDVCIHQSSICNKEFCTGNKSKLCDLILEILGATKASGQLSGN
eukprot:859111-Ditylum_brightwellii.AAC.1